MELVDIRPRLRSFIMEHFLTGEPADSLKDSTLLLTTGIISSIAMLELVAYLEEECGISFRDEDLAPERLDSVDRIAEIVEALTRQQHVV